MAGANTYPAHLFAGKSGEVGYPFTNPAGGP
jgi:hypothetical protein